MRSSFLVLLLSSVLVSSVTGQDFGGGFGGDFGSAKFCAPFKCRKSDEPVPKWPLKLESPGCSGMGGVAMFSPGASNKKNDPVAPCCDQRHACYQTAVR